MEELKVVPEREVRHRLWAEFERRLMQDLEEIAIRAKAAKEAARRRGFVVGADGARRIDPEEPQHAKH